MAVKRTCLLFAALAICVASGSPASSHRQHKLHHSMSEYHLEHFFNLKSLADWEGHEYDLVTPSQTEEDGSFLSHDLGKGGLANSRRRRSAENGVDPANEMFYRMHMFSEEHHLRLKRNSEMLHRNFMINIHDKDEMSTHTFDQDCFYHGSVKSHADSDVAISNCDSELMGVVRKRRDVYHIHPLPEYLRKSEHNPSGHSHLVYKVKEKKATGAVKDIFKHYDERQRRDTATTEPPPANSADDIICSENTPPVGYDNSTLGVDYADTMALQLYEPSFVDRSFGDNYVQAAIFIDHTMVQKHNGDEEFLIRYHLSMFNIVSLIYQPTGTRYSVRVVLITLKIFRSPQNGLFITQDSSALLENFCRFQQTLNPPRPSPWRWNHAFLVTGYGLCFRSNRDCGELGRAPIEGVCIPDRECSVNREGGLNTAFVMAHELGHNLGMFHDGHPTESRSCPYQHGYLMAPSTGDAKRIWKFSPCSIAHLRRYLRSRDSACMDKGTSGPTINEALKPSCSLPGKDYTADEQCSLQFRHWANRYRPGHKFKFCSRTTYGRNSICRHLFCDDGNARKGCYSTYTPAMDGTWCGTGKVCYRFDCVDESTVPKDYCAPDPKGQVMATPPSSQGAPVTTGSVVTTKFMPKSKIDGNWSPFSAYSQCTRTCGPGLRYRVRHCNNPRPANGGKDCEGSNKDYDLCNLQTCAPTESYSESTCTSARGSSSTPVPPTSSTPAAQQCALTCRDSTTGRTEVIVNQVPNGLPCSHGYCLDGKCSIGCDGNFNSNATIDRCGVCGGDGSTCKTNSGTLQHPLAQTPEFSPLKLRGTGNSILRGSWAISIRENAAATGTGTVFALRDNNRFTGYYYYLNGPDQQERKGVYEFDVANARGRYENVDNKPETLTITGKTNRPLVVEIKVIDDKLQEKSISISYNFTSPLLTPAEKFFWKLIKDWSVCTVNCGRGVQYREYRCINKLTDSTARPEQCVNAGKPTPSAFRICVQRPCSVIRTGTSVLKLGQCKNCIQLVERKCIGYTNDNSTMDLHPRDCGAVRMALVEHCNDTCSSPPMDTQITAMCTSISKQACTGDVSNIMCPQGCGLSGENRVFFSGVTILSLVAATLLSVGL